MHTVTDIRSEYDRLDALCGADSSGIALSVSTRAVKRLGCFTPGEPPKISISAFVMEDDALFWDTIRHEYAHALVWLRRPWEKHGHDAVWKAACREVGCTPRATAQASAAQTALREQTARYRLRCKKCGAETLYLRRGRIVRLIQSGHRRFVRCAKCGSSDFELAYLK